MAFNGTGSNVTSLNASNVASGTLAVARGGTGTASPSLVGGTNITISGSWPNQTVTASGGGVTSLNGQTGAITDTDFLAIGSYSVFMNSGNSDISQGSTIAGSTLRYGSVSSNIDSSNTVPGRFVGYTAAGGITYTAGGTAASGTWRKMCNSDVFGSSTPKSPTTYYRGWALYVRVS